MKHFSFMNGVFDDFENTLSEKQRKKIEKIIRKWMNTDVIPLTVEVFKGLVVNKNGTISKE